MTFFWNMQVFFFHISLSTEQSCRQEISVSDLSKGKIKALKKWKKKIIEVGRERERLFIGLLYLWICFISQVE